MNLTAQRWMRRHWFSVPLLVALLFRALVPVGYMPGVGSDGAFTVMLCPGYAPMPAPMADMPGMADMAGMPHSGHGQHQGQGNCEYAAATTGTALARLAPAMLLPQLSSYSVVFPPDRYIPRGTIVPTRLPRGPPIDV